MRVCMLMYDVQDFGGLEEYAINLATGLRQAGHDVSVLSVHYIPPGNQYARRVRAAGIPLAQPPRWISHLAADWATKERVLAAAMTVAAPITWVAAAGLAVGRRQGWSSSLASAHGWLRRQIMTHVVGPNRSPALGRAMLWWWRLRWRPDVVHMHGYTSNLLFAIEWAHARGLPVAYQEHQTPDAQFDWWKGFDRIVNKANLVVAASDISADKLRSIAGVTRPIVASEPIMPDPMAAGWRRPTRPPGQGPTRMVTLARLYVTKGLIHLLDAIVDVRRTHPDTVFTVYGDGPLRDGLLAAAAARGLDGRQIFQPAFTDRQSLTRILGENDVFVMSSILEGQPLALIEAMAHGCPIVTTTVGGIPELIQDGVNGLLCPPADAAKLADAIRVMIDDPALRDRLGRAVRQSYEKGRFSPATVCQTFVRAYQQAINA